MQAVRLSRLKSKSSKQEAIDADNYCLKTLASENLKEKPMCADHSDEFVNKIFELCAKDTSPYGGQRIGRTHSLTDIL